MHIRDQSVNIIEQASYNQWYNSNSNDNSRTHSDSPKQTILNFEK